MNEQLSNITLVDKQKKHEHALLSARLGYKNPFELLGIPTPSEDIMQDNDNRELWLCMNEMEANGELLLPEFISVAMDNRNPGTPWKLDELHELVQKISRISPNHEDYDNELDSLIWENDDKSIVYPPNPRSLKSHYQLVIRQYEEIVGERAVRRAMTIWEERVNSPEERLSAISEVIEESMPKSSGIFLKSLKTGMRSYKQEMEQRRRRFMMNRTALYPFWWGRDFGNFDIKPNSEKMLHMPPGDLIAIVGPTGSGKSTITDQIATFNAAKGLKVLYCHAEDTHNKKFDQFVRRYTGVDQSKQLRGEAQSETDWFYENIASLWTGEIQFMYIGAMSWSEVMINCKAQRPDIILFDYAQKISELCFHRNEGSERERILRIFDDAKALSEFHLNPVPVVMAAQANAYGAIRSAPTAKEKAQALLNWDRTSIERQAKQDAGLNPEGVNEKFHPYGDMIVNKANEFAHTQSRLFTFGSRKHIAALEAMETDYWHEMASVWGEWVYHAVGAKDQDSLEDSPLMNITPDYKEFTRKPGSIPNIDNDDIILDIEFEDI